MGKLTVWWLIRFIYAVVKVLLAADPNNGNNLPEPPDNLDN